MLEMLLIADNTGVPLYSRSFTNFAPDPQLFSGLISVLHLVGVELFKKDVASIIFGEHAEGNQIFVISREIPSEQRRLNFVFVCNRNIDQRAFREIVTAIFIEIKPFVNSDLVNSITRIVDKIIDTRFNGMRAFCS